MHSHLKKAFRCILLTIIASTTLDARNFDIHISIPISYKENPEVYKTLLTIQDQIVTAAAKNGYCFNSSMMPGGIGFHITLETAHKVDERDIKKCIQCIEAIQKTMRPFDLTTAFIKAQFTLKGTTHPWGVLKIAHNPDLEKIALQLRDCFKKAGLLVGRFEKFEPHISLGKFFKHENESLPEKENLHWVPDFKIRLSKESFMIKRIDFSKNEMSVVRAQQKKDPKSGVVPRQSYELGTKPKKSQSSASNKQLKEQQKTAE